MPTPASYGLPRSIVGHTRDTVVINADVSVLGTPFISLDVLPGALTSCFDGNVRLSLDQAKALRQALDQAIRCVINGDV